jgi:hydroxypyruvate isomerase
MSNNDSLEARLAALEARNEEQHKEVANKLEVAFELINKQTEIISGLTQQILLEVQVVLRC